MLNFWSKKTMMGNAKIKPITFSAAASMQQWKVPAGVRKIHVDCAASQGMNGGKGGRVQCDLKVSPGQILYIMVGPVPSALNGAAYNASDIRIGGSEYSNRVIVAGGGGNASSRNAAGGAGGGLTGGAGSAGGAGYYGGGSGGAQWNKNGAFAAGGGGGSSYTKPELCSEVVHTQGFRSGAGYIILS